jgi:hypothetical protein
LKFSDSSQQAIIYGPSATADYNNAERVIIQGAPGYAGTNGEGGDVYLWAGPGGSTNGNGGDIKIRGGRGNGTGEGGYLYFQTGSTDTGYAGSIRLETGSSGTYGQGGPITLEAKSGGRILLRTYNSEGNSRDLILANSGNLTLPGNITFPDNTVQTTAYTGGVVIPAASNLVFTLGTDFTGTIVGDFGNGSGYIRVESNTGAPNFTPAPISTAFYNFLSTITAGTEFTVNTVVDGTTYNTVVSFTQFAGGNPVAPNRNDLYYTFVSGDTLPFSYSATALTLTFEGSTFSFTTSAVTFPDGTVQTTAYPGITTVAKTGANLAANNVFFEVTAVDGSGAVTELTVTNSPNPAWTTQTSGVALVDVNFTVSFDGSGNASVTVNNGGTGHSLGQTFNLQPDAVGATVPSRIALDLTKSVNKLTEGSYSLADGVEGQIMYLVAQNGITDANNVSVLIANSRITGIAYTNAALLPFRWYNGDSVLDNSGMTTIIFTDGCWQQQGGYWDLI